MKQYSVVKIKSLNKDFKHSGVFWSNPIGHLILRQYGQ